MKTDIKTILDLAEKIIQTAKIIVAEYEKSPKRKKGAKKSHGRNKKHSKLVAGAVR